MKVKQKAREFSWSWFYWFYVTKGQSDEACRYSI